MLACAGLVDSSVIEIFSVGCSMILVNQIVRLLMISFVLGTSGLNLLAQEPMVPTVEVPKLEAPVAPMAADATKPVEAAPAKAEDKAGHGHEKGPKIGEHLSLWSVIPFAFMLGCIAILPLVNPHWWEHNTNRAKVAGAAAIPTAIYLLWFFSSGYEHSASELMLHAGQEYLSFVLLLGSLFIISGGIYIQGSLDGTPIVNTVLLAIGAILASLIGTTGASMVLIRPLIRANASRKHMVHVVIFFIFIVSNCGGLLTPIGDPPLFLGFLKGVPFFWTATHLWQEWLLVNVLLLVVFNIWDQIALNREEKERAGSQLERLMTHEPLRIIGLHNVLFLAGVVAVIILKGSGFLGSAYGIQEGLMALLAVGSYFLTNRTIHEKNRFSFAPIIEVAILFAGIFVTMIPALEILGVKGKELGLTQQWQFFWASGALSSCLDNAPTYLTFVATASGMLGVTPDPTAPYLATFLQQPGAEALLIAISCGSVFMGAVTYIGNGPNFMVKAIAEENDVKMPSFFGYTIYSFAILIPIFVVVTLVFFRG
jgi:Na+/H+ antiporter NhaD/arsenite permease-like protein